MDARTRLAGRAHRNRMNAIELIHNVTLLVTLCVIYRLLLRRMSRDTIRGRVVFGLIFGGVGILSMMSPWRLQPGVVFDGRSVLVGLAGVFGGFLTAAIASVMSACYRLFLGGEGMLTGCAVIVSSGLLGVMFHRVIRTHPDRLNPLNLYGFGVVVHLVMLAWMLSLPGGKAFSVVRTIAIPVLVLLPFATMVVGWVLLDQEAQRAAEDGLRESEGRLRAILENSPAIIFVKDLEGRYLQVNPRFEEEFNLSRHAIIGRADPDLFPRAQAEVFRANDSLVLQRGKPQFFEEAVTCRDGERVSLVSKFPLLDASGRAYALCGIAVGITERKRAEEALRKANATLQSIFDAAPVAVLSFDLEGRITYWSRGAERMLGWTVEEALGRVCPMVPEEGLVDFREMIQRVTSQGSETLVRTRQRKSGERLQAKIHAAILRDPGGQATGVLVIMEDITEKQRAEEVLRQSEQQLRALSSRLETLREEERTRISREIHDELGQMLTGIKMALRWIEDRLDVFGDDPRVNPILDKLVATAELTDATAKTVQRIAAELRPGVLDKLGLPMSLQFESARFEERTGLPCRLDLPEEVPPMGFESATAFFRIFQEALTNVVRHAQATEVEAELRVEAQGCRLEIRDNGRGLGKDGLDNPASLGLRGMQERARLVGGAVSFAPRPGGGTVVAVFIPHRPPLFDTV